MKKFDQIKKYMDGNKSKPVEKVATIDFLPASKFLYHTDKSYDHETIIKFFSGNNIKLKDFYRVVEGDKACTVCGKNHWLIWRDEFMYYDNLNHCFINTEDDEELEASPELEEIDFAVYICPECGAWSTLIFANDNLIP